MEQADYIFLAITSFGFFLIITIYEFFLNRVKKNHLITSKRES